ncbi:MAG: hypothetical protein FGM57_02840 [Candidatus Taylorbacteria bacterium]|nr:hypothetical protein [Candidatus Taylorbacteria bacterium]
MSFTSRLKSLEINGFKSFAKKGGLVFNSPITAIVGPNGSGKSNVAESFRFVLGEQSIKSMRGKKGEDLIFNGGKDSARANRASVKVVFDNTNRMFNVDFDEVSIERIVHRDGVNEYYINGTSVRLKDVAELLAYANIGSSGHHIISQGEADRLLSSQPRERREMIEDALGLKVYQYRKEESEKKLQKTENHIKEIESLRRELAPHIKFLRKQVEKIEKSVALRSELVGLYKEYFGREHAYIQAEKAKIHEDKKGPEAELKVLQEELNHHKEILDALKANLGQSSQMSELLKLEASMRDTRQKKDSCMRELGRLEGEVSYLKRTIERKLKESSETSTKQVYLRDVEVVTREVEGKVRLATEVVDGSGSHQDVPLEDRLSEVKHILSEITESVTSFVNHHKEQSPDINKETKHEEEEIARITHEMKSLEEKLKLYGEEEAHQSTQYTNIKAEIDKERDKNVESEKAVLRIMSKQNEVHSVLEHIKNKEERLRSEESDFKRELEEAHIIVGRDAVAYEHTNTAHVTEERGVQLERKRTIEKTKIRLEEMGGAGGDDVMREFKETEERDLFLAKELEDLMTSSESLKALIADLNQRLDALFKEGIQKINKEFGNFFRLMFGGGEAELKVVKEEKKRRKKTGDELEDGGDLSVAVSALEGEDDEPVEEGIDIHVSLPHKRIKGLTMLSGGERALTSIALLFAMSQVNPPPFVILDETDAALDEANSRKYGDMIEALSKHSQLILITHNRETMSRAGVIYGVTMGGEGYSKLLSIAFEDALAVAK